MTNDELKYKVIHGYIEETIDDETNETVDVFISDEDREYHFDTLEDATKKYESINLSNREWKDLCEYDEDGELYVLKYKVCE